MFICVSGAQVFISYLTATANDNCIRAKRQTISADDVITALNDTDFTELVGPLKESLEGVPFLIKESARHLLRCTSHCHSLGGLQSIRVCLDEIRSV
jgi:hypothetical protein